MPRRARSHAPRARHRASRRDASPSVRDQCQSTRRAPSVRARSAPCARRQSRPIIQRIWLGIAGPVVMNPSVPEKHHDFSTRSPASCFASVSAGSPGGRPMSDRESALGGSLSIHRAQSTVRRRLLYRGRHEMRSGASCSNSAVSSSRIDEDRTMRRQPAPRASSSRMAGRGRRADRSRRPRLCARGFWRERRSRSRSDALRSAITIARIYADCARRSSCATAARSTARPI
jgi:hypothetical protein